MFQQILDPVFGSLGLSALVAVVPLVTLFVLLGVFRVKAWKAALVSLALSIILAISVWQMPPLQALSATAEGVLYGVVPILWILVTALWVYRLSVVTGWFEVLGERVRAVSDDQRVLAILIAFCFGALLESLAGFGAPVAISAAMLMAAGMKPLKAAVVSLLANTAPVAFGAMAAPIITLSAVTGIDIDVLSQMAGRQTPFVAVIVPLILVFLVDGMRGVRQTWPVALVAGVVFGLAQFVTANYIAVEITDIVAAVVTVAAVLLMLRVWQPKVPLSFPEDGEGEQSLAGAADGTEPAASAGHTTGRTASGTSNNGGGTNAGATPNRGGGSTTTTVTRTVLASESEQTIDKSKYSERKLTWYAVLPYVVIIAVFSVSQIPVIKEWLSVNGTFVFQWPGLDVVSPAGDPVGAMTFKLGHIGATGTLLLLSGIIVTALYKISPRRALGAFTETIHQLRFTIITVVAVLALSFVMNLSGQTQSLGFALASAGGFFALLSPLIGWVGVAITGSDTSSNSLFGLLQVTAATQAGLDPVLMASANSSAGVLGKMLSPQNLAVAAAAVGMAGKEGDIFRKLIGWSLGMLVLFTGFIYLQSTPILSWMVPAWP